MIASVRSTLPDPIDNRDEQSYLDLVSRILREGAKRNNRTGVATLSIFGAQMRYDLSSNKIPVFTTKKIFWKGIVEELLWFIRANTNSKLLAEKGVHIWDANGSRSFLDSIGLGHREEGDLGPIYGFQWRHFGAQYVDFKTDYTHKGVDQLNNIINEIRNNPDSRRLVMSAWNPTDLPKMALPPCHMYQRSADMGLGVPFNVASYSLLTHLMAHWTNLRAKDFIHTIGDAHVYETHVDALREQIKRKPKAFPTILIKPNTIESLSSEHIELCSYEPMPPITMKMAV